MYHNALSHLLVGCKPVAKINHSYTEAYSCTLLRSVACLSCLFPRLRGTIEVTSEASTIMRCSP